MYAYNSLYVNLSAYSRKRSRSPDASSKASGVRIRPDELQVLVKNVWQILVIRIQKSIKPYKDRVKQPGNNK